SVGAKIYDEAGDTSVKCFKISSRAYRQRSRAVSAFRDDVKPNLPPHAPGAASHTVLLDHRAHVYCWELGALPALSQALVTLVIPSNGIYLTLKDVKKSMLLGEN
ncbi:hypothetical protein RJZ56_003406, partial [Blastomyces dermatitidis]